jgi:hypothetical protein
VADRYNLTKILLNPGMFYDPMLSERYGVPLPLSYVPLLGTQFTNSMNVLERTANVITYTIATLFLVPYIESAETEMRERYPPLYPSTEDRRRKGLYLVGSYWGFEWPRPISSNVEMVGPLLADEPQPLPSPLYEWVEQHESIMCWRVNESHCIIVSLHKP